MMFDLHVPILDLRPTMLTVHVWPWWRGAMVSGCFEPVHDPAQHEQTAHDAAHAGATSTLAPLPLMMSTLVRPPLPRLVTLMAYRCDVGMPPWHHTILHQRARAPPLNTCERGWVAPSRRSTAARGCAGRRGWAAGPQCPRARASTRCPTGCATTAIGCAHTVPPGQPPVHRAVQAGAPVHCTLCTQCTCTCTRTQSRAGWRCDGSSSECPPERSEYPGTCDEQAPRLFVRPAGALVQCVVAVAWSSREGRRHRVHHRRAEPAGGPARRTPSGRRLALGCWYYAHAGISAGAALSLIVTIITMHYREHEQPRAFYWCALHCEGGLLQQLTRLLLLLRHMPVHNSFEDF